MDPFPVASPQFVKTKKDGRENVMSQEEMIDDVRSQGEMIGDVMNQEEMIEGEKMTF